MWAVHLEPKGASYIATKEEFLSGSPLPLTDAIINPENASLAPREVRTAQRMIELEGPQRLWWWILSLVLLLLLAETLISNRTYR